MKKLLNLPVFLLGAILLVSCSTDPVLKSTIVLNPRTIAVPDTQQVVADADVDFIPYFGFLDGDGSATTYIDMPAESSPSNLIIGRWSITKLGIDENNDGNIIFYAYDDYDHKECGNSFLQFNNDGIVFENIYYGKDGSCTLEVEIDDWEVIGENRFQIYVYNNIYVVTLTETELVLKYDWDFENSLYGPAQYYYYYKRV